VDARLHHLQGEAEGVNPPALADLIREFYLARVSLLMRHEDIAVVIPDYDVNNAYQYIIAREETHLSWLVHALLDLGMATPPDPARGAAPAVKGDGWKALAAEDARANAAFVAAWRPRVDGVSHARHQGMLAVILGEMLEHTRLFDQAAEGRHDLIGTSLAINDHSGTVMPVRFVGDI
jgi:hypothetical protein